MRLILFLTIVLVIGMKCPLHAQVQCGKILAQAKAHFVKGQLEQSLITLHCASECDYKHNLSSQINDLELRIYEKIKQQKRLAEALKLAGRARTVVGTDQNLAMNLIKEALDLDKHIDIKALFRGIYSNNKFYRPLYADNDQITSVAIAPDHNSFAIATDSLIKILGTNGTTTDIMHVPMYEISNLSYSSDGKKLLVSGWELKPEYTTKLCIIDLHTKYQKPVYYDTGSLMKAAYSSTGNYIVASGLRPDADGVVCILFDDKGKEISSIPGRKGAYYTSKLSPDEQYLVTGTLDIYNASVDDSVNLWWLDPESQTLQFLLNIRSEFSTTAIAFHPKNNYFLTGTNSGYIFVYYLNGHQANVFRAHDGAVTTIDILNPDENTFISGSGQHRIMENTNSDCSIKSWDTSGVITGSYLGHSKSVLALDIPPAGNDMLSFSGNGDNKILQWHLPEAPSRRLENAQCSDISVLNNAGDFLALKDQNIPCIYNIWGKELFAFPFSVLILPGYCASPDGKYIYISCSDTVVRVFQLVDTPHKYEQVMFYHDSTLVEQFAVAPANSGFLTLSHEQVVRYRDKNGKLIHESERSPVHLGTIGFSGEGETLCYTFGSTINILNAKTFELIKPLTFRAKNFYSLKRDDRLVTRPKKIKVTNTDTTLAKSKHGSKLTGKTTALAMTKDDSKKNGSDTSAVTTTELYNNSMRPDSDTTNDAAGGINAVAYSSQGSLLAIGGKFLKILSLKTFKITNCVGHKGDINDIAFSPDGQYLASASEDKTVKVWDLKGNLILDLVGHRNRVNAVAFTLDGKHLLSGSNNGMRVWNLADPENYKELIGELQIEPMTEEQRDQYLSD